MFLTPAPPTPERYMRIAGTKTLYWKSEKKNEVKYDAYLDILPMGSISAYIDFLRGGPKSENMAD